jgi:pimeloyl-ACP methyl ester carboxylesterase
MTDIRTHANFQGHVDTGAVALWTEQQGDGPDVLLIAGLSDPVEAWGFQLAGLSDRYRLTAFDNRSAGRSPMSPDGFTVVDMADDAAALLRSLGIEHAHVMGFSGGSVTAQELALRHPDLVDSLVLMSTWARADAFMEAMFRSWEWLVETAPDERAMLEAFFMWVYTARAHDDGTVAAIIEEALAFPHAQSSEGFRRQLAAWRPHDTFDRLPSIDVPTLVLAGDEDIITPPRLGRIVAERIPGADFIVLPGEAHQPFQERPELFNDIVAAFWARVDSGPAS